MHLAPSSKLTELLTLIGKGTKFQSELKKQVLNLRRQSVYFSHGLKQLIYHLCIFTNTNPQDVGLDQLLCVWSLLIRPGQI